MDEELPEGCHHYSTLDEVPWDIQKYWHQRHTIFSNYDEGIWLTDDAWFGVTPEPMALRIAEHMAVTTPVNVSVLIDAFAGAGGNTIAFAQSGRWEKVIGIEKDAQVLECAKHNAKLYDVEEKIEWVQGDCFEWLSGLASETRNRSAVFASPPWGGQSYRSEEVFDLSTMQPYTLKQLYNAFTRISRDVVFYLPRSSNLRQVADLVPDEKQVRVVHYCMSGASKALCIYFGDMKNH